MTLGLQVWIAFEGLPVPVERRGKPSAATKAKRGFPRVSDGQEARSARLARRHGRPRQASTPADHVATVSAATGFQSQLPPPLVHLAAVFRLHRPAFGGRGVELRLAAGVAALLRAVAAA